MTSVTQGRGFELAFAIAVLLVPAALGSSTTIFNDGDVSWHIATGQWILDQRAIPHSDPFSFTWFGKPWVPIEWLAEIMMAGAYRLGGYSGIAALVTAALIALHGIVFLNAARFVRPFAAVGIIVAMDVVLIPMMLARPHLIAWTLVAGWTWLMLRSREADRAPPLGAALLMVIWANLHGSFVMGLGIAAAFGLEALLASPDKRRVIRQWGLFGLACAAAVLVNANGLEGLMHPFKIANLAMLPLIEEWKPSSVRVTPFFFLVLAAALVLIALKRPRLTPVRWLMLGGLLVLALLQVRHQAVLAIVAVLLVPTGFAARPLAIERKTALFAAAAALALVAVRAILPLSPEYGETHPWRLIAAVPPELRGQPVLNGYAMGGPLILAGIRPYVDGRGDMYGDALVIGYKRIIDGDPAALEVVVQRWNIRWAILPHRYTKLNALLGRTPGWRQLYKDQVGAVYVRG